MPVKIHLNSLFPAMYTDKVDYIKAFVGRSVHHERTVSATTFITLDKILKYKTYCYKFRLRIPHLKNILFISEPANLKRGRTKRRKSVSGRRVSNILFKF